MKFVKNEKGVTLIELVVVMIVSVILMGIIGTIILSTTGYFTKTTIADQDKLSLDKLVDLVDGEITYATDVIVTDQSPDKTKNNENSLITSGDNWHYFLFKDGILYFGTTKADENKLYHDSEPTEVFSDGYYANRKLYVSAKGYENSYRLDLIYGLYDYSNVDTYKTKSTIAFPNLKIKFDQGQSTGWFNSVNYDSFDSDFFYIYYNRDGTKIEETGSVTNAGGGTVAEQYNTCITKENNKGEWKTAERPFKTGDFVYSFNAVGEKVWYRYVGFDSGGSHEDPGENLNEYWKEVYVEGSEPKEGIFNQRSNYFQGDVVRYFNYQQEETDFIYYYFNMYKSDYGIESYPNEAYLKRWAPVYINPYQPQAVLCTLKEKNHPSDYINSYLNHSFIYDSPFAKLYNKDENKSLNPYKGDIVFYEYHDGDTKDKIIPPANGVEELTLEYVVKYKGEYYINMSGGNLNLSKDKPGETHNKNKADWQKLQTKWDENSVYEVGDVVLWNGDLYRCKKDTFKMEEPKQYNSDIWERIWWNQNSEMYMQRH